MTEEASLDRCIPTTGAKQLLIQPANGVVDKIELLREDVELEAEKASLRLFGAHSLALVANAVGAYLRRSRLPLHLHATLVARAYL
jgi:hypothetical protein